MTPSRTAPNASTDRTVAVFGGPGKAGRHVLEDMSRTVHAVRASDRDWTVVRVPMLTDGPPTGSVRVGHVGVNTGPRIARADLARFMLEQLDDPAHVRASPVVSAPA